MTATPNNLPNSSALAETFEVLRPIARFQPFRARALAELLTKVADGEMEWPTGDRAAAAWVNERAAELEAEA